MRNGRACQTVAAIESERIVQEQPEPTEKADHMAVSVDGSFIHLCNGEWREVKLLTVGLYEEKWQAHKRRMGTHTSQTSYFAQMATAEAFAQSAHGEWQRRGCEKAQQMVAVNDGAIWIQHFLDYHAPQAVRVLDFAHAASYLATVGNTVFAHDQDKADRWFRRARRRLLQQAPSKTLNTIAFLQRQLQGADKQEVVETALSYLQRREAQIDYAHFRRCGYPIGSGSVESGHKVVIQRRMKQAGMRWHEDAVNPMLALRNAICNRRWDDTWVATREHLRKQRWRARCQRYQVPLVPPVPPVTLASVKVTETSCKQKHHSEKRSRPAIDHPWRRGVWPERHFSY